MKGLYGLYRFTGLVIGSGVVIHPWAPLRCLRFSRFPFLANATDAVNLSSRFLATHRRHLLNKTEMSSKVNSSLTVSNQDCDETVAKSSDTDDDSAVERSDALEGELSKTEIDVYGIAPALPKKSFSLAAYVNESETLRKLVMLGVNLSKIEEKDMGLAEKLLKLDFVNDIKPALLFLHQCDVKDCDIGECITGNPSLLCEPIDDLEVRVNYLKSKRFSKAAIATIVSSAPAVLTATTKQTDTQLGYLQQDFMLSGICFV